MNANDQLRAFIDRILRLKEEQDNIGADIREVYAEAKAAGFDKTALGQVVGLLRKKGKDAEKFEEQSTLVDMYMAAYEGPAEVLVEASHALAGARARENIEEITLTRVPPEVAGGQPYPSSDAAGAKSDGAHAVVGQGGQEPGHTDRESEQENASAPQGRNEPASGSEATAEDFIPPAFLLKREHQPLRPLCQRPDMCAGYGRTHCRSCLRAAGESEAA